MNFRLLLPLLAVLGFIGQPASAQWVTESYPLKPGWNAIWLPHDCSDRTITTILASHTQIIEVWRWNPLGSSVQFTQSPSTPIKADTSWAVWRRGDPNNSTLGTLTGNSAYLVNVAAAAAPFTLPLLGKPLAPAYRFSSSGLNFLGFPTQTPDSATTRNFDTFFSFSEALKSNPSVYFYNGGPLSDVAPKNPNLLATPRFTAVSRGKAYWVKSLSYSDYYGPLQITVLGSGGIDFGKKLKTATMRIKNVTDPAKNQTITATLTSVASEAGPGQPFAAPQVAMRLRGARNASLQFTYSPLPTVVTLAPGEEKELVLDADRTLMSTPALSYQSILRITDSLGHTRIDLPVSAIGTSKAGVWIGAAVLDTVNRVEMINGPETDAPVGTPNGAGADTVSTTTTTNTTNAGQTTSATTFNAAFDTAGNAYLDTAGLTAANVSVTGLAGTPTYVLGTDYTLVPSTRATVTNGGSGYTEAPTVKFTGGGGTGATATATLSAGVQSVSIDPAKGGSGGSGYVLKPKVTFTGGDGSGATGFAVIKDGFVTDITVTNGGAGYTTAPTVDIKTSGEGAGTVLINTTTKVVTGVTITNGGFGYSAAPTVTFSGGAGTGAAGTAVVNAAGLITGVTITNGGSGYTSAPTIAFAFTGGGSGAAATAKIVGSVGSVTIAAGGSGYTAAPAITFEGGNGSGAAATAQRSSAGAVTGVDTIHKGPSAAIGASAKITVSTVATAPNGTPVGTTTSTVTSTSKLVTLNGKSRVSTRRVSTGGGAAAPSQFPVRLILHAGVAGAPTLLQQVYLGERDGTSFAGPDEAPIATLVNSAGPTPKGKIARVSTASFPRGEKWTGGGTLGGTATFTVGLGYNAPTNPFLHTYHPDHDNWDARYESLLSNGRESYTVSRVITLTFSSVLPPGVSDLDWGVTTLGGTYTETITGLRSQDIGVSGSFILHQVSEVPNLTLSPP